MNRGSPLWLASGKPIPDKLALVWGTRLKVKPPEKQGKPKSRKTNRANR